MPDSVLTWCIIAAYLCFMMIMGVAFRRFNADTADYFRGGSRAAWWMVGVSIVATSFSARSFTANAGSAFEAGYSIVVVYLAVITALLLQAWILAPLMRQMRATTFAEVVRDRFDVRTQQVYVWAKVAFFFIVAAIWLWGVATFIASVFHFPITSVIVVVGMVTLVVSATGGVMAVMASDVIQVMIMVGMTGMVTILALVDVGGVAALASRMSAPEVSGVFTWVKPSGAFAGDQYTAGWLWAIFVLTVVIQSSMEFGVRYFAAKDSRSARRAAWLATGLTVLVLPLFFVPAWTARLLFPGAVTGHPGLGKPEESAFAVTSLHVLPEGLIGLLVVAMLAVTMGTLDSGLNRNAALIVNDGLPAILRRLGRQVPGPRTQLRLSRIITVILGVLCIWLAVHFANQEGLGMFEFANEVTALILLPLAIPICAGIFWKRVPAWSALASAFAGTVPSACAWVSGRFLGDPWTMQETVWWVLGCGTIVFFGSTPWWKSSPPEYREKVEVFFAKLGTPVDFEREVGGATDALQSKIVAGFCLAAAGCVLILLPFMDSARGVTCVVALSAFLGAPGLILWRASRTAEDTSNR